MKSESIKERDKRLEKATRKMIESAKQSAQLYLGTPGSQSRGRKPKKSAITVEKKDKETESRLDHIEKDDAA